MRPLPAEIVHDPIEPGPYRMAMGLTIVPPSDWFEIDVLYADELAEKSRLLAERHTDVFASVPGSEAASAETLTLIANHLCREYPDWFVRSGDILTNRLTNAVQDLREGHPLEQAGRLVQEDLCLIQNHPEGPVFTAAVLCFPSRWRLSEKIGRPRAEVHGPVPLYADRLAAPVDRFMRHLRPERIAGRLNWSVVDDPALFQPTGKFVADRNFSVTPDNAGDRLFLRVERQTFRRLPVSDAILFGIRVHVYPLWRVASAGLADAVRALPADIARYKSLPAFRDALLAWLEKTGEPTR